jgi:hypothetical protein
MQVPTLPLFFGPLLLAVAACSSASPDGTPTPSSASDAGATQDVAPPADGSAPSASGGPVEEARAFRGAVAKAVCAKLAACCSSANREAYFSQFREKPYELSATPSPADCERVLAATLGKLDDKYLASIERGSIVFDRAKAASCVASVSGAACGVPLATAFFGSDCWGPRGKVFVKKRAPGEACENIGDGTYYGECDPTQGFCGNVSKKCEPWRRTNEECSLIGSWAFCAPGLNCDNASPSRPGKCSAAPVTVAIGRSCTALSGPTTLCGTDAFCNYTSGKCEAKKADGQACQHDEECTTLHPFTCSPFGAGTCGQTSFCSGSAR